MKKLLLPWPRVAKVCEIRALFRYTRFTIHSLSSPTVNRIDDFCRKCSSLYRRPWSICPHERRWQSKRKWKEHGDCALPFCTSQKSVAAETGFCNSDCLSRLYLRLLSIVLYLLLPWFWGLERSEKTEIILGGNAKVVVNHAGTTLSILPGIDDSLN